MPGDYITQSPKPKARSPKPKAQSLYSVGGMLAAIVLAAGASTRMGTPKALLEDGDGCPFVVRIVRTLAAAGLAPVTVVASSSTRDAIEDALAADPIAAIGRVIVNPSPERGQLS